MLKSGCDSGGDGNVLSFVPFSEGLVIIVLFQTHQPHENGNQLDDVRVGDRVEAAVEGVDDGDTGRGDDGRLQGQVGDDGESGALVIGGAGHEIGVRVQMRLGIIGALGSCSCSVFVNFIWVSGVFLQQDKTTREKNKKQHIDASSVYKTFFDM